jgi:YVTN family beta-propeller protein
METCRKMKNRLVRKILLIGIPLLSIGIIFYAGHKWGLQHAKYMTGGTPHPSNCFSCHAYLDQDSKLAGFLDKQYISPFKLKVTPDGKDLLITAHERNHLMIYDIAGKKIKASIPVGIWPHSIAIDKTGSKAYISNHWSQNVSVVDLSAQNVVSTIEVGSGPSDLVIDQKGEFLYVNNSFDGNLSIIELEDEKEIRRIPTGNFPIGIDIAPDGEKVFVTHRRTITVPFRKPPITEVAIIDTRYKRITERKEIHSAHIMENISFTPSGDLAIFTLIRPKNLVPSTQIEKGWMITEGIGIIETGENGKIAQLLLDEPNRYFPDPYDVVISPDGKKAFVSHAGVDYISVLDVDALRKIISESTQEQLALYANHLGMSSRFVIDRIETGPNPKGLAVSPDGSSIYIAERYADQVSVLDVESLKIKDRLNLGGPGNMTLVREGGRLFFNAGRTFQNQYSCSTCHPDGSEDGLTYDLTGTGRDLENTITLRELSNTSPFKWNGKNVSVYMQCGMRFSKFVTRTESFSPDELNAVVAFMFQKLENPPNAQQLPDGMLTEAQERGRFIFERTITNDGREIPEKDRCITCHPPPYFTDRTLTNVGSSFETDKEEFFDTPKLNNIIETAPYLHDGRAKTLEEIWTVYEEKDTHGFINDLTKQELNDLIEYLKSIGPAHTYKGENTKYAQYE